MEIFGSTFDDSVFEECRNRVPIALSSYNAKSCEPKWFCENVPTDDELEEQKVFKFRADLAYSQNDYKKALADYSTCLSLIPKGNVAIRRDVLEGQARCHCHLGRREEPLEIADLLKKEATNTGHLTCALNLQLTVQQLFGDVGEEISVLRQLVSLHPYNPWYWQRLARCYWALSPSPRGNGSRADGHHGAEMPIGGQSTGQGADVQLKACMCFVRTRLLIHLLRIQQSSFVLQCNERALEEVEEALRCLGPDAKTLQLISEVMAEDLVPEKMKEDNQDGESLDALCNVDFDERWTLEQTDTGYLGPASVVTGSTG
uniref:Zgc:101716 n=1 Tax=Paramormyrops kingsleyae TaxID=1676925 RepID=A0A3B3QZH2_9TELE